MLDVKQMELEDYKDIKAEIKNSMVRVVVSFVEIGYYLKKIRDDKMYLADGYKDIWEAAEMEFGLKRKQAWSFMNINDKYSVDGNSTELLTQYVGFSKSLLTEMLTLPDEDYELVKRETRIEDIRELKQAEQELEKEIKKEEEQVSGQISILDTMPEAVPEQDKKPKMEELTQADAIKRLFRPKEMRECLNAICTLDTSSMALEYWVEDFNPSGNRMDKVMPYFIFFYKYQDGVKIKNIVTQEIVPYTYLEFCGLVRGIFGSIGASADYWDKEFGAEYQRKKEEEKQRSIEENQGKSESKELEKMVSEETEDKNSAALKENVGSRDYEEEKKQDIVSMPEESKEIGKEEVKEESKATGTDKPTEVQSEEKPEVVEGEVENAVCDIAQDEKSNESEDIKYLKVREQYIDDIKNGRKCFTIRRNDKDYKVGQIYTLRIVRMVGSVETYLTDYSIRIRITYILDDFEGLSTGYIAMGYEVL